MRLANRAFCQLPRRSSTTTARDDLQNERQKPAQPAASCSCQPRQSHPDPNQHGGARQNASGGSAAPEKIHDCYEEVGYNELHAHQPVAGAVVGDEIPVIQNRAQVTCGSRHTISSDTLTAIVQADRASGYPGIAKQHMEAHAAASIPRALGQDPTRTMRQVTARACCIGQHHAGAGCVRRTE